MEIKASDGHMIVAKIEYMIPELMPLLGMTMQTIKEETKRRKKARAHGKWVLCVLGIHKYLRYDRLGFGICIRCQKIKI